MLLAILVYVIYNNLLTISQGWVANGQVSFAIGVLVVHLVMLFLLPFLFYHRIAVSSFLRLGQ
jgi:lipopolysaccharide export system permease protein